MLLETFEKSLIIKCYETFLNLNVFYIFAFLYIIREWIFPLNKCVYVFKGNFIYLKLLYMWPNNCHNWNIYLQSLTAYIRRFTDDINKHLQRFSIKHRHRLFVPSNQCWGNLPKSIKMPLKSDQNCLLKILQKLVIGSKSLVCVFINDSRCVVIVLLKKKHC